MGSLWSSEEIYDISSPSSVIDESLVKAIADEPSSVVHIMDLIKTVRGLDQSGPGQRGENLDNLWNCLVASTEGKFHAAEESTLRWLLKSMNGSSNDAETLRRWPLTWTILDCVFQRVPLFSLAKSLADRRFMVVLHQTLADISQPAAEPSAGSPKRKRPTSKVFVLEELKDEQGCLMSGDAVFNALRRLLGRLRATALQSSHDKIGAEHIRSLFCTSAAEAASLASLACKVAALAVGSDETENIEGREVWIETISSIWDLHLQGNDDALEISSKLFTPAASIISKLEGVPKPCHLSLPEGHRKKWSKDLQKLLHHSLIIPSRAAFLGGKDFTPISQVLSSPSTLDVSATVLYFLASGATKLLSDGGLRRGNAEWMKRVFQAVQDSLRRRDDRDEIFQVILERAAKLSMPIDNNDLRKICRTYALRKDGTNWRLVADIATCDSDVFQLTEEAASLLQDVCERSTSAKLQESEKEAVSRIVGSVVQGFRTGRDFASFLKLWYKQLCKVEKSKTSSPWLNVGASTYQGDAFSSLIEKELSTQQLLDVLSWVETQPSHSRALCLFTNELAQGIKTEAYSDAVGRRMFDMVSQVSKTSSTLTAFKWGVVSKTLSWVAPQERNRIWDAVKKQLSKILKDSPIKTREVFEAFQCCCQAWVSMSPDGDQVEEPFRLVEAFTERLATDLISSSALKKTSLSSHPGPDAELELFEEISIDKYLLWYLRGLSRLTHLFFKQKKTIPPALHNILASSKGSVGEIQTVWKYLLDNEHNLNDVKVIGDLVDRLVNSLEADGKEKRWPEERSRAWIQTLSGIPLDALSRPQRERIMVLLKEHRQRTTKRILPDSWKMILGLSTKLMARPTFYEGMSFDDNVQIADAMADLSSSTPTNDGTLSDLISSYFEMASAIIRQMTEQIDDRSIRYFEESQAFLEDCDGAADLSPFRLTLLKAFGVETARSPSFQSHDQLRSLTGKARTILGECIMSATGYFLTEKKAFEGHNVIADLRLLAAVDAAEALDDLSVANKLKKSEIRKAEKRSHASMLLGDLRGWKTQIFLRSHFSSLLEDTRPTTFHILDSLPAKFKEPLLLKLAASITKDMDNTRRMGYLQDLIGSFSQGSDTDGQVLAIQHVVTQLIESPGLPEKDQPFDLATAHSELASSLPHVKTAHVSAHLCRILHTLLEKKFQSMTQWNIELTLSTVSDLASPEPGSEATVPYVWLCKLVETIIKKHRLRLEGHHHLLLTTMQLLLRNLVQRQTLAEAKDVETQESKAHVYARLITLICEPTAGAVSRSQHQSALDSATDAAKRSAGRHMYLVMMQYVKLQLEGDVSRAVREALEPAMNSIFDITPPEVRKILNDAMDGSGRAILKEMFKRYTKFGKWSGV